MELLIPLLDSVPATRQEDTVYINVDEFFKKMAIETNCPEQAFRKDNFKRSYKESIVTINDEMFCKLIAIIIYCINARKKKFTCKTICSQVKQLLSSEVGSRPKSA